MRLAIVLLTITAIALPTKCTISVETKKSPKSHKRLKRIFPLGYQSGLGPLFTGVCVTKKGTFPAKITRKKRAYFAHDGKVMRCRVHKASFGVLVINRGKVPKGCRPRGFEVEGKKKLWLAVHMTPKGLVPGGATEEGVGSYTLGRNVVTNGAFYWVC